jgi:hypothetical protein
MQFRPDAEELLADVAALLENDVLPAVSGALQHQVRVAAHLVRVVERELRLGPDAAAAERERLAGLLGGSERDLVALRAELSERLLDPAPLDEGFAERAVAALVHTVRDDLVISKPGYDEWQGPE